MSEDALLPSELEARRELERELDELDNLWSDYSNRVKRVMEGWEKIKVKLLERISKVSSLLRAVNEDLEKIDVEIMLGIASEEEKKSDKEKLIEIKNKLESRLKALQMFLEDIESRIVEHSERIKTS
ncbi:MAG: hypothetical protein QXE91_02005 [Thermofilaceae archaeon]